MMATHAQLQKLWMLAERMKPHLNRNDANMEKLLKMLTLHDDACRSAENEKGLSRGVDCQASQDVQALWMEFKKNESYEAKIAHAIIHLAHQMDTHDVF